MATHSWMCAQTGADGLCRASMGSVVIHVARRGQFFATRESARQFIAEEIDTFSRREGVILDWAGVQAVTGAFAAEYAIPPDNVQWLHADVEHTGVAG